MSIGLAFTTILGGALFGFLCNFVWGKLVESFGPIGGWVAAGAIVGTTWSLNHGVGFVHQTGAVFMDMAIAVVVACLVCSTLKGAKLSKAVPALTGAGLGGIIAGVAMAVLAGAL